VSCSYDKIELCNKAVGGENSYSSFEETCFNDVVIDVVRKITPYYCNQQDIVDNTKFILNYFQMPLFSRTISNFMI
jgi:hypothetical protein